MESKHVDEIYKRVMKNIEIARIYAVGANNVSFTSSSPASLNTQSDLLVSHRGASASPTVQPARSGRSGFTKSKSIGTKNSPSNLVITTGSGNTKSKSNPATSPTLSSSVGATKAGASSPPSLEGSGSGSGSSNGKAKKAALAAVKSSLARQAEEDPTALVDKLVNRINDTEERSQKLVEKFRTLQNSYSVVFNEQFRPFDYRAPFPRPVLPTSEKPRLDVICFFFGPVETTKVSTFTTTDPDWNAFKDVNTDRFSKELQLFSSLSKISLDKVILAHAFPHVISKNKGLVEDRQMELAILWTKEVVWFWFTLFSLIECYTSLIDCSFKTFPLMSSFRSVQSPTGLFIPQSTQNAKSHPKIFTDNMTPHQHLLIIAQADSANTKEIPSKKSSM
eukprot:TRINITY_DN1441_c0_g1_i4.p1 TRINITY_DN1441_c0_g1~~TRINITY_DN1441_c0_g1_i4.p1  ORF type:complete len:411 (+),score=74.52 TRINITY_DN1441_c0_g1_i4:59-1234(+)